MKKILICVLIVCMIFNFMPKITAYADALTLSSIAAAAYAIAQSSGLSFTFSDSTGSQTFMQNKINSWLQGRTIAQVFGTEAMRLVAGKLVIPGLLAQKIVDFLDDLIEDTGIQENDSTGVSLGLGIFRNETLYPYTTTGQGSGKKNAYLALPHYVDYGNNLDNVAPEGQWIYNVNDTGNSLYYGSTLIKEREGPLFAKQGLNRELKWGLTVDSNGQIYICTGMAPQDPATSSIYFINSASIYGMTADENIITGKIPGLYDPPEGLNDLSQWEGDIQYGPDTNLEDLLDDIFEQVEGGTLEVDGEVTEGIDDPVPTIEPGTGSIDGIQDLVGDISETLEGVETGVGEIADTATDIAEGVTDITEALDVPQATAFQLPDLRTLFPFCIPFDLYAMVNAFSAMPQAPRVQIPFNIPALGLNYTFDIDLSDFDGVASTVRTLEFVAFAAGLAVLTSRLIKW